MRGHSSEVILFFQSSVMAVMVCVCVFFTFQSNAMAVMVRLTLETWG